MLPSDSARTKVLRCLTDPENRLRVHQGLLLVCLSSFGYPEGFDAESWWRHHEVWFVQERDPVQAARVTQGWSAHLRTLANGDLPPELATQLQAANYQERGEWGGHLDFGEAFQLLQHGEMSERLRLLLKHPAAWWPSSRPALWYERMPEDIQRRWIIHDPKNIERAQQAEEWERRRAR